MKNDWKVIGGSIAGPGHVSANIPNQDAYAFEVTENYVVLAVADGAGSLELSHFGSKLASSVAVREAKSAIALGKSLESAVKIGIEQARAELMAEENYKLMGTTLTLAAATKDEWALGLVGDSFAVLSLEDGHHEFFNVQEVSEYANITKLLTSSEFNPEVFGGPDSLHSIALATDGLELASIENKIPTKGFWDLVHKKAHSDSLVIEDLLRYMDSQEKIDDDTTLVIASLNR